MVNATINGIAISVEDGTTILEAARKVGVEIPTLCYLKEVNEIGACRVCVVEVEGQDRCVTACNNVVQEGMVIRTNTRKVRTTRKTNVKFILSQHDYVHKQQEGKNCKKEQRRAYSFTAQYRLPNLCKKR